MGVWYIGLRKWLFTSRVTKGPLVTFLHSCSRICSINIYQNGYIILQVATCKVAKLGGSCRYKPIHGTQFILCFTCSFTSYCYTSVIFKVLTHVVLRCGTSTSPPICVYSYTSWRAVATYPQPENKGLIPEKKICDNSELNHWPPHNST
jgi:hypothetical protein